MVFIDPKSQKNGQNTFLAKVTLFEQLIVMILIIFRIYLTLRLEDLKVYLTLKKSV
jgi:hypothetical protein